MGRQIPVVIKDDAPSSRLVSAELWKGDVRKRSHAIALWHTGSDADTKDLVAEALVRVLEPEDRPWDPNERLFLVHRPPHDSAALHPAEAQTPLSQRGQRRRRRARAHSERRSNRGRRGPSHKDPRSAAGPWRMCTRNGGDASFAIRSSTSPISSVPPLRADLVDLFLRELDPRPAHAVAPCPLPSRRGPRRRALHALRRGASPSISGAGAVPEATKPFLSARRPACRWPSRPIGSWRSRGREPFRSSPGHILGTGNSICLLG
jgi:hypothetical protein